MPLYLKEKASPYFLLLQGNILDISEKQKKFIIPESWKVKDVFGAIAIAIAKSRLQELRKSPGNMEDAEVKLILEPERVDDFKFQVQMGENKVSGILFGFSDKRAGFPRYVDVDGVRAPGVSTEHYIGENNNFTKMGDQIITNLNQIAQMNAS